MASRIGRKFAQATYPEASRAALSPYARNFAHGGLSRRPKRE